MPKRCRLREALFVAVEEHELEGTEAQERSKNGAYSQADDGRHELLNVDKPQRSRGSERGVSILKGTIARSRGSFFLGGALDLLEPLPRFLDPELQLALKSLVGEHGTELLVKLDLAPQVIALVVHTMANNIATARSRLLVVVAQTGAVVRATYVVTSCCCIKKMERAHTWRAEFCRYHRVVCQKGEATPGASRG